MAYANLISSERMVFPLWRSLHSVNLMLPKEDRRAMLLRIFNEETPLVNTTSKRQAIDNNSAVPPTASAEEQALKEENVVIGQDQQEQTEQRETWNKAGDEEDRFNTTV